MVSWQRRKWVKGFGMSRETVNLTDISADFFRGLAGYRVVLNQVLKLNCSSCNGLSSLTQLMILLLGISSEGTWLILFLCGSASFCDSSG